MSKICIIGAGMFGMDLAVSLAAIGHAVTVYEKRNFFLEGTTAQSLLRIHSGFHYPRDFETANQSSTSYPIFFKKYKNFIHRAFPNYYAIARVGSKTSTDQFEKFIKQLGYPYTRQKNQYKMQSFFASSKFASIYQVKEGVLDINGLKRFFKDTCQNLKIDVFFNREITDLIYNPKDNKWEITSNALNKDLKSHYYSSFQAQQFDFVIDATHSQGNFYSNLEKKSTTEFQIVHMVNFKCQTSNFGLTVLDGNFITVLPFLDSQKNLMSVYSPEYSVKLRHIGISAPSEWLSSNNLGEFFSVAKTNKNLINLLKSWIPGISPIEIISTKTGIRSIEANVQATDRRTSQVFEIEKNFFKINSTKIDHCVQTTEQILHLIGQA